jgi:hypothetical protein
LREKFSRRRPDLTLDFTGESIERRCEIYKKVIASRRIHGTRDEDDQPCIKLIFPPNFTPVTEETEDLVGEQQSRLSDSA